MKNIVIIIPPESISQELEDMMRKLNSKYNTTKALFYKPHITLKSLGDIENINLENVVIGISDVVETIKPLSVNMHGLRFYGSREGINGIYISVKRSPELFTLHKKLVHKLGGYEDGKDRSYKELENWNPHLTLVGNDIDVKNLEKAKRELNYVTYYCNFPVDEVTLMCHTEEGVVPYHLWYWHFMLSN